MNPSIPFPRVKRGEDDRAASPVIGVILMVGTTVILAATVYAWAGAYSHVPDQAVKVLALSPADHADPAVRAYTVAAVMPGLRYEDLNLSLDGVILNMTRAAGCPAPDDAAHFTACGDAETLRPRDAVQAGDVLLLRASPGQTLRVMDSAAGVVVLSVDVG